MGYTCADTTVTMDYTCMTGGMLTVSTMTPIVEYAKSELVTKKEPAKVHPRVMLKGGFYNIAQSKRQLFLAGYIHKPSRKACIAAGKVYPNQRILEQVEL
jgi:hypothetical protein